MQTEKMPMTFHQVRTFNLKAPVGEKKVSQTVGLVTGQRLHLRWPEFSSNITTSLRLSHKHETFLLSVGAGRRALTVNYSADKATAAPFLSDAALLYAALRMK